jgi:hypothetical protein
MKTKTTAMQMLAVNHQPTTINQKERRMKRYVTALAVLGAFVLLGSCLPAFAGNDTLHAQSQIIKLLKIRSACSPIYGAADANVSGKLFGLGKLRYRYSHEQLYYNYTYGNDGSGIAEHLKYPAICVVINSLQDSADDAGTNPPIPKLGSAGTSQYLAQTWLPNDAGDQITVTWNPDNFLQVDMTELTAANPLSSRASLTADGGLFGSVELMAWIDDESKPHVGANLTGVFEGMEYDLVPHSNGVVSLHFKQPLSWTVPGRTDTFYVSLQGSINHDFPGPNVSQPQQ